MEEPAAGSAGEGDGKPKRPPVSLLRHGSILSLLTLVSRLLGLVREMVKARLLGTTALADAFSVAFMLPNLFRRLFAEGSIAVAFIPTFKEYLLAGDKAKNREFLSCVFTFLTFFVTLAVMAGILAAPVAVRLFGLEQPCEAVLLTRVMFPFLAFMSVAALFQGILNSLNVFAPSALAPIVLNIVTIICAWVLSPHTDNPARALAVGILLGGFLGTALQLPFVLKNRQRFFFTGLKRAFSNPGTRKVLLLVGPTIIGMAAHKLNDLVSVALAGNAGEGVVSGLQYSLRLQELILGVFAVSIGTVLLPNFAEYAKSAQWKAFNERLVSAMDIIALVTVPVVFFALAQGEILIRLIYQSNAFDVTSVQLTLSAFTFHMPGLVFIALNRILAPAFYAQSNSKSPTLAGICSFAVNIVLAIVFVNHFRCAGMTVNADLSIVEGLDGRHFRGAGIALALSVSSAVNTALLLFFLRKNPNIAVGRALASALLYTLKLSLLSAVAIVPVLLLSPLTLELFAGSGRVVSLGVPLAVNALMFGLVGFTLLAVTKDRQLIGIVRALRRRRGSGAS